jgi:hypothetical protein
MLTAYPEKIRRENNSSLSGIDSLIGKPFDLESLRGVIAKCVP